jgi:hypothetical protein
MATAMIRMVMTNTPLGHLLDSCELIVEQNFIGGCVLADYFSEPVRQFTDIFRKLRREVLEKVMRLRSGGIGFICWAFFSPLTENAVYAMQNKKSSFFILNAFKLAQIERDSPNAVEP